MALALGSLTASKIYLGATEINLAYFGATQVYTSGPVVSYLLDDYSGSAVGYSLRNLSSSWTSSDVVEVRRSSDNATLGFTATEVSDGTMLAWVGTGGTDNGFVTTWYDQSGNTNHATQATPASQPKVVDAGVLVLSNGNAAIKSTSSNLMTFSMASLSADGQQSVFGVLENDVTSQDGFTAAFSMLSSSTSTGGVNRRPFWFIDPSGNLLFSVDSDSGYSNTDRDRRLYSHIMEDTAGGTSTVYQDGTQVDTRLITLDANASFSLGGLLGAGTNAVGALYMSEVIYYPSDQSASRVAIEGNIASHYDITI